MALPISGPISLSEVNVELNKGPLDPVSLNDVAVRGLAGKPLDGEPISMADLLGKSNLPVLAFNHSSYTGWRDYYAGGLVEITSVDTDHRLTFRLDNEGGHSTSFYTHRGAYESLRDFEFRVVGNLNPNLETWGSCESRQWFEFYARNSEFLNGSLELRRVADPGKVTRFTWYPQ